MNHQKSALLLAGLVAFVLSPSGMADTGSPATLPQMARLQDSPETGAMQLVPLEGFRWLGRELSHIDSTGNSSPVSAGMDVAGGLLIQPDGAVWKSGEKVCQLQEGEWLLPDGNLVSPAGVIVPLCDHYARIAGRLVRTHNGSAARAPSGVQLGNGAILGDYGRITLPDGTSSHLQDGQRMREDGKELQAWDAVVWAEGAVRLYKDGSILPLEKGRSMMMNDGTKVQGDGTIVRRTRGSQWSEVKLRLSELAGGAPVIVRLEGPTNQRRLRTGH